MVARNALLLVFAVLLFAGTGNVVLAKAAKKQVDLKLSSPTASSQSAPEADQQVDLLKVAKPEGSAQGWETKSESCAGKVDPKTGLTRNESLDGKCEEHKATLKFGN